MHILALILLEPFVLLLLISPFILAVRRARRIEAHQRFYADRRRAPAPVPTQV
jgi:hypothetical protein